MGSVMKDKLYDWKPEGSQVYYKNVGQKQRNRVLAEYNLRLMGLENALSDDRNQYVFPTRP